MDEIIKAFNGGQHKECLVLSEKTLSSDSKDFNTLCYKGTCLAKLGSFSEAIEILSRCINEKNDYFFFGLQGVIAIMNLANMKRLLAITGFLYSWIQQIQLR